MACLLALACISPEETEENHVKTSIGTASNLARVSKVLPRHISCFFLSVIVCC